MELCVRGLKEYPNYATAHLVLGRCYETVGRGIEAMLEYRRALKALPDNPVLQKLMHAIEQRERDAFAAFSEERTQKLQEQKDSLSVEEYVAEEMPEKESTVEFLLKRLQAAQHSPAGSTGPVPEVRPTAGAGVAIVTPTLAEIYASQGEYDEAIDAYKRLQAQRPHEKDRYEQRIAQLEQLKRLQQEERAS